MYTNSAMGKKNRPTWVKAPPGFTVGRTGKKSFPHNPKSSKGKSCLTTYGVKKLRNRYVTVICEAARNPKSSTFWWNVPDVNGRKTFKQISLSYLKYFHKNFKEEDDQKTAGHDVRDCRYVFPAGNSKKGRQANAKEKIIIANDPLCSSAQGIDGTHNNLFERIAYTETGDSFDDIMMNFKIPSVDLHLLMENCKRLGIFITTPSLARMHEPIIASEVNTEIDLEIVSTPARGPDPDPDPETETVPELVADANTFLVPKHGPDPETTPELDSPHVSCVGDGTMKAKLDEILALLENVRSMI